MKSKDTPIEQLKPSATDEAAARWSETLRETEDRRVREAFEGWLSAAPENAASFRRAETAQALARSLADAPELRALRDETLARTSQAGRRRARGKRYFALAASLLVAVAGGVLFVGLDAPRRMYGDVRDAVAGNVYKTDIGQRSTVTLDDGSSIVLNTDSRVSVHYASGLRGVTLERGQALFKVAKDRTRPFVVSAGGREVTALGTEFDVRLSERMFEVTLLEGRVTVTREAHADAELPLAELRPGQQFVATARMRPHVRTADVKRVVSWPRGQVVFENERLDDAVAEMNRYSRQQVTLADPRLASLRISGAFNTGDTGTFVEALIAYFPIEQVDGTRGKIVLSQRPPIRG